MSRIRNSHAFWRTPVRSTQTSKKSTCAELARRVHERHGHLTLGAAEFRDEPANGAGACGVSGLVQQLPEPRRGQPLLARRERAPRLPIASAASLTSSRAGAGRGEHGAGFSMGIAFALAYRRIVFRESPSSRTTSRIGTPSVSTLCRITATKSMGTILGE